MAARYKEHVDRSNMSVSHISNLKQALQTFSDTYGESLCVDFGPNRLRALRQEWVNPSDPKVKPASARTAQYKTQAIKQMFKWASARELLPASVHGQLRTLEPLKQGYDVPRTVPVKAVSRAAVDAVRPFLAKPLTALIDLQLCTAARPGELLNLTAADIDPTREIWRVKILHHKTAHHGKLRALFLGPKAQTVIKPFQSHPIADERPL